MATEDPFDVLMDLARQEINVALARPPDDVKSVDPHRERIEHDLAGRSENVDATPAANPVDPAPHSRRLLFAIACTVLLVGGLLAIVQMPPVPTEAPSGSPLERPPATRQEMVPTTQMLAPPTTPRGVPTDAAEVFPKHATFLGIGESVMLTAADALEAQGNTVDAAVNRPIAELTTRMQELAAAGGLGDIVVLHVGSQQRMTVEQVDSIMAILTTVPHVIVISLTDYQSWSNDNNALFETAVATHPNTVLLDWASLSQECVGTCFAPDGELLLPDGSAYYLKLIRAAILEATNNEDAAEPREQE